MDKKRKGILKKSSSTRVDGSPGGGEEGGEGTHQLHWDEEGIAEYDKQRGHKMKVSEPKTPYSYDIPVIYSFLNIVLNLYLTKFSMFMKLNLSINDILNQIEF
jgi:hypothetical protein